MKSAQIDRLVVICAAAILTVWACCLLILWHASLDASGASTLVGISATLGALSIAVVLPGRLMRLCRWTATRLGFGDAVLNVLDAAGLNHARPDSRGAIRLLAASLAMAAIGGLASVGAVFGGGWLADRLAERMLFSPTAWMFCRLAIQLVGMLPIAIGAAVWLLVASMIRVGSGRYIYATVFREWLWGVAVGLVAFGVCWMAGLDVRGLTATVAVLLLAGAAVVIQRERVSSRPVNIETTVERPAFWQRMGVGVAYTVVTLSFVLQLRLLGDAAEFGLGAGAFWAGGSIAMLCVFLRRADRKSQPPGIRQRLGATTGVLAGLGMQAALLISALSGGSARWACLVFVIAFQLPIAAMAALILSRQRRLFAYAGGRARTYFSIAAAGGAVAIVLYILVVATPLGPSIMVVAALGLFAAPAVAGILIARRRGNLFRWAANGVLLLASLAVALLGAVHEVREQFAFARPGVWLTGVARRGPAGSARHPAGMLPSPAPWRSARVDRALVQTIAQRSGRWLTAVASMDDLPSTLPVGVHFVVCPADPSALPDGIWPQSIAPPRRGMFSASRHVRQRFDGALLTALPGDHPQAWRCYSRQSIRRFLTCLHSRGVAALRIQATDDGIGTALAAVKGFSETVGQCWLVADRNADRNADRIDLLVVGPIKLAAPPLRQAGLLVVPADQLWYEWPRVRPLDVLKPRKYRERSPSIAQFFERLAVFGG